MSLLEIFLKATSPAVPPKVPIRGSYQEKLKQLHQEENPDQKFISIKATIHQCKNYEGTYHGGIPKVTPTGAPSKKRIKKFQPSKSSAVAPRKEKLGK